jgi:hypothetical protein
LNSIPIKIASQRKIIERIKETPYKDLGSSNPYLSKYDKFKILNDSSYLKMFNSEAYLKSCNSFKPEPGSGSSLVVFNRNHELMNNIDLANYNIYDFDVNELSDRIALLYGNKDSTFLSYYDLKTFKFISNVFSKKGCYSGGEIYFSKSGAYLLNKVQSGTVIYLGNKLYYGIEGDLYGINNDENVAISNSRGTVYAYDLEKKIIIWSYKIGDDYGNTKFFKIDDKIYLISGRALSWEGYKVKENGIMLHSFVMSKPLFSLVEFVKNPEEIVSSITKKNEVSNNEKNNPIEQSPSQVKKSDDDLLSSYLALMFLYALSESSNKYSGGSYSSSYNKSSSSSSSSSYSNTNNEDVYICTSGKASGCCRTVVVTSGSPKTSGCCPRTDGRGCSYGHSWSNCGKSGNKNYQCSSCGITVRTASQPKNSCCPVNDCGTMHYWNEIK